MSPAQVWVWARRIYHRRLGEVVKVVDAAYSKYVNLKNRKVAAWEIRGETSWYYELLVNRLGNLFVRRSWCPAPSDNAWDEEIIYELAISGLPPEPQSRYFDATKLGLKIDYSELVLTSPRRRGKLLAKWVDGFDVSGYFMNELRKLDDISLLLTKEWKPMWPYSYSGSGKQTYLITFESL